VEGDMGAKLKRLAGFRPLVLLTSLLIVSILAVSCGNSNTADKPIGEGYYHNDEHGFSLTYPEGWEKYYPPAGAVAFKERGNDPKANIFVVVESTDQDLDGYVSSNKKEMQQMGGISIDGERQTRIARISGYELTTSLKAQKVKQQSIIFIADGKAYCLIFSALADVWDEYRGDVFRETRSSFRLDD
jgi:hypothetical protein